jgi:hypothetical protein
MDRLLDEFSCAAVVAVLAVLALAAVAKAVDRHGFAAYLGSVVPDRAARPVAVAVPAAEAAIVVVGVALDLRMAAAMAAAFVASATIVLATALRAAEAPCACFGPWSASTASAALRRNVALAVLAVCGAADPTLAPLHVAEIVAGLCLAATILLSTGTTRRAVVVAATAD